MRRPARFAAALVLAAGLAACDRLPLDPGEVRVEVVSPDLGTALTTGLATIDLRVTAAPDGATVTVDGQAATFSAARGLYSISVGLVPGLNALAVEATTNGTSVLRDTVYALRLDVRPVGGGLTALPARAGASATPLPGGATLLAGGVGTAGALATTTRLGADGTADAGALVTPRAGHSASVLPSGDILLLGGATTLDPTQTGQFVSTAEVLSPDGLSNGVVAIEGGGFLRAGHTTRVLETASGRTVLYVYGGRDASAGFVAPTGTVAILEWLPERRLVRLSPPLGAGAFPEAEFHAQLDLPGDRAIVLDGAPPDGGAARFTWSEPGSNFPFDMRIAAAEPLPTPRRAAAVAPLGGGLWLVAGGETADGETSGVMEVYAPAAGRAFRLGPEARLATPRTHASAANLSGARIALVGGLDATGAPGLPPEIFAY